MKKNQRIITLDEILASGELDGYFPTFGNVIDKEGCEKSICSVCGDRGAEYYPFEAEELNGHISRRAFAVCRNCGNAEEF